MAMFTQAIINSILPLFIMAIDEDSRPSQDYYETSYFLKTIVTTYSIREDMRRCIVRRWDNIVSNATEASSENNVPSSIILMVGFFESHLGCHPRSGGNWGAPTNRNNRLSPGNHHSQAHSLRVDYDYCVTHRPRNETRSNWERAVSRFRCGFCNCPAPIPRIIPMMREGVCRSTMSEVIVNNTRMCLTDQNIGYSSSFLIRQTRRIYTSMEAEIPSDI
jgi:hypothetical protein